MTTLNGGVLGAAVSRLGTSMLGAQAAAFLGLAASKALAEALEESRRLGVAVEAFVKRWEQHALWLLLDTLPLGLLYRFAHMERAEVEEALIGALERVVRGGIYVEALTQALDTAPYITTEQRGDLQHGLEHAAAGEFDRAVPPLMVGLEGALCSVARAHTLIDAQRRLVEKPDKGPVHRVELVVRRLPADEEYARFVCARVFGNVGNPVRHGEESGSRRRHALFVVVAIAGWLDAFMEVPAREVLGQMLRDELISRP
jgi:hypothetical protein